MNARTGVDCVVPKYVKETGGTFKLTKVVITKNYEVPVKEYLFPLATCILLSEI